jgi:hypothetical protein
MQTTPNWGNAFNGAIVYISWMVFFYILAFYFLLRVIGVRALDGNIFIALGLFLGFLIFYLNAKYFKHNDKYLEIEKNFKDESEKQRVLGNILVIVLAIGSMLSFLGWGYFANKI